MSIYERVLSFIRAPEPADFEAVALEVFRYQASIVAPYGEYCRRLGISAHRVSKLDDIPAVSTLAFKYARLAADQPLSGASTFQTSGTTSGRNRRGTHLVSRPDIYRASALAHLRRMLFPDAVKMRILAIHPTADRMRESSLSQMISWCIEEFGDGPSACVADRESLDAKAATDFLVDAARDRAPVAILGTTASLGALFEYLEDHNIRISLEARSRIMDTGGLKGQARPLDADTLCSAAGSLLAIEPAFVINEYGMTELCSQLYDATALNSEDASAPTKRVKIAPPWMRAAAIDPLTLKSVAPGQIGMLRFFDLANVGSVSAILTEDFGIVDGDRVRVIGRIATAEPRGCALGIEQFEAAERRVT